MPPDAGRSVTYLAGRRFEAHRTYTAVHYKASQDQKLRIRRTEVSQGQTDQTIACGIGKVQLVRSSASPRGILLL